MNSEIINYDIGITLLILVGGLVRYIPQVYSDIANRKGEVILSWSSVTKARHICFLYFCILLGFLIRTGHYPKSITLIFCGIFIFILGNIIGLMSFYTLNKHNSYNEELVRYENGVLITQGIYSIVRHPMRIGQFLEMSGIVILANTPFLLVPLIVVLIIQNIRTRDEEKMLINFFGEEEIRYMANVPKYNLVCGLLRRKEIK